MRTRDLNLEQLRNDTPAVKQLIHFNNAGAALMPAPVIAAVTDHLLLEASLGGYEAAGLQAAALENVYTSIGRLINALPEEIAVVENATRAWDMAFYSLPLKAGDVVLTSASEYAGNYIPYLQLKQQRGIEIRVIPNDEHGQVSLAALQVMLDAPRVALVSLPMIATNGGPVQPVEQIGALARAAGVLFLLDACQGVGQLPIDVRKIGCHMLAATSRKYLRGPRGMGFLYVERALCQRLEPVLLDLHAASLISADRYRLRDDARRFENWECNVAAKLGLGAAVDYALAQGIGPMWARIQQLANELRRQLAEVPDIVVQDPPEAACGIVTFTQQQLDANELQQQLANQAMRINVSTSRRQSTLLDMEQRGLLAVSRASVHAYNTESEIETFVSAINQLLKK